MSQIDLKATLPGLDGKPMKETDQRDAPQATLGGIIIQAMLAALPIDQGMAAEAKIKHGKLIQRIYNSQETDIEFTAEEIALIKQRVAVLYPPFVVLRVWTILDPASVA